MDLTSQGVPDQLDDPHSCRRVLGLVVALAGLVEATKVQNRIVPETGVSRVDAYLGCSGKARGFMALADELAGQHFWIVVPFFLQEVAAR